MKRGFALFLALIMALASVSAQELSNPGITPGNPLYGLDRMIERMQVGISGQGIPRARIHMLFAEERLSEAQELIDNNGNPANIAEAVIDYEDNVAKANLEVEKAKGIGLDVSSLSKEMEIATDRHVIVLELVLERAPDSAKSGLERALENAKTKSAQLKEENKKAGLFTDITGADVVLTQEELIRRAEELRKREEELNQKEEEDKKRGLITITGFATAEQQSELNLLRQRMGVIFMITILGTFLYFYYISHRRHKELVRKYKR